MVGADALALPIQRRETKESQALVCLRFMLYLERVVRSRQPVAKSPAGEQAPARLIAVSKNDAWSSTKRFSTSSSRAFAEQHLLPPVLQLKRQVALPPVFRVKRMQTPGRSIAAFHALCKLQARLRLQHLRRL